MPPEPQGAAAAGRQRGESADGRARRAWVDRDGSRSATLGELLTVKRVRGYAAVVVLEHNVAVPAMSRRTRWANSGLSAGPYSSSELWPKQRFSHPQTRLLVSPAALRTSPAPRWRSHQTGTTRTTWHASSPRSPIQGSSASPKRLESTTAVWHYRCRGTRN